MGKHPDSRASAPLDDRWFTGQEALTRLAMRALIFVLVTVVFRLGWNWHVTPLGAAPIGNLRALALILFGIWLWQVMHTFALPMRLECFWPIFWQVGFDSSVVLALLWVCSLW